MKQSDRDTSSHGQLIGLSFKEGGFMPCEDDEDLCDIGSGGDRAGQTVGVTPLTPIYLMSPTKLTVSFKRLNCLVKKTVLLFTI